MTGFSNGGGGGSSTPGTLTIPGQSYVPAASGPATTNTRRPVLALGGEGDVGLVTPTNSDVCQRYGFTIPSTGGAAIARFRFRLRNSNALTNTNQSGAITLGALAIGTPNTGAENQWNGDFTAVPTTVVAAPGSTELGTSEYVSPWVSPSTFQLKPNTFYGLTLGFTCPGVQVNYSNTPGWSWVGTGSAAANLVAAAPGTTPQPYTQYLDLRMEYEFAGTNEIGLFIGDSIMSGWLNTFSGSISTGHMGPDNSWPHMACLRVGHHPMNAGVGGGTAAANGLSGNAATFGSIANNSWTRFLSPESGNTVFAATPDYAIIGLGINDAFAAATITLAQYQAGIRAILSILAGLGIPTVYMVTATPGAGVSFLGSLPSFQSGQLNALPATPIASLKVSAVSGPGPNTGEPGAGSAWWTAGTGPYTAYLGTPQSPIGGPYTITAVAGGAGSTLTATISGSPARPAATAVGVPVLTGSEYNRQAINLWVRSLPPGVQSVIDFDADVTTQFYYPSSTGRPEYYNNAGDVHPTTPAMYSLVASRFVNGILGN